MERALPVTPFELRTLCRGWPRETVRSAVLEALYAEKPRPNDSEALAGLVAIWLTDDDASEAPPLNAYSVRRIWHELIRRLQ